VITVQRLTRRYGDGWGVRDLTFEVREGEVFGYLGPNGAGKTTTIRHLLGFLRPQSGRCRIGGRDCWTEAAAIQAGLGYIPGEVAFPVGMTGARFLSLLSEMRGTRDRRRLVSLLERFDLDPGPRIRRMSKGTKQKLAIVAAWMHDPAVLVLDEPTAGLDPLMQTEFAALVAEERGRGKTVLMSSHSFGEVDRTCDRAGIIREGELVDVRDVGALRREQRRTYVVTVGSEADVAVLKESGFEIGRVEGRRVEVRVQGSPDAFVKALGGVEVEDLETRRMTLEQVFMGYYGDGGSGDGASGALDSRSGSGSHSRSDSGSHLHSGSHPHSGEGS
jgi:ABC-2 type transport system ATP-binding protein